MNRKLIILLLFLPVFSFAQLDLKKTFKFSTFYGAINGGTSISSVDVFSVTNGLQTQTIETPYDYSISLGVRKIARFGYENKANTFYDGTESSFSDAATIGKVKGLEFLFEADYRRVQGVEYFDQHHFLRYVSANQWMAKVEYLKEGFADIEYFEASERYRFDVTKKLSINIGAAHRVAEPYGYDPLEEWQLSNGNLHYTYLALQEGYNVNVFEGEYYDPSGQVVATSSEIWEAVVIPQVLQDYTKRKKDELPAQWNHSLVLGFDYYQYSKTFWLHTWGSLMPYHYDDGNDYSYHKYEGKQWLDYSGGLIFGTKITKHLGTFVEGTYNKYWNRTWHDFKLGINYVIF